MDRVCNSPDYWTIVLRRSTYSNVAVNSLMEQVMRILQLRCNACTIALWISGSFQLMKEFPAISKSRWGEYAPSSPSLAVCSVLQIRIFKHCKKCPSKAHLSGTLHGHRWPIPVSIPWCKVAVTLLCYYYICVEVFFMSRHCYICGHYLGRLQGLNV